MQQLQDTFKPEEPDYRFCCGIWQQAAMNAALAVLSAFAKANLKPEYHFPLSAIFGNLLCKGSSIVLLTLGPQL